MKIFSPILMWLAIIIYAPLCMLSIIPLKEVIFILFCYAKNRFLWNIIFGMCFSLTSAQNCVLWFHSCIYKWEMNKFFFYYKNVKLWFWENKTFHSPHHMQSPSSSPKQCSSSHLEDVKKKQKKCMLFIIFV